MNVDWQGVVTTLGSTAIITAALGFLAKIAIEHVLRRDIDTHAARLKQAADTELADARARVALELARSRERADTALATLKGELDRTLEAFKTDTAARAARADRVRQEIARWANPILGAVVDLEKRLGNILDDEGHLALTSRTAERVDPEWSIDHEYFLTSTVYLVAQYQCWIRLLQEQLSFELFEAHAEKDAFFGKVHAVGRALSGFPLEELRDSGPGDRQVFVLQQREMGELVAVGAGAQATCMRYADFVGRWAEPAFRRRFDPLVRFLDGLGPDAGPRWRRLQLVAAALGELQAECRRLLTVPAP